MIDLPIRTFSYHYRKKYGHQVGKLPVHMGQLCPNRKKGGCLFCSAASFSPSYLKLTDPVITQIEKGKRDLLGRRFVKYFVYFQQESCTAVRVESLVSVLQALLDAQDCVGAILSTRPDCIEDSLLDSLSEIFQQYGKEIMFELGIQSMHQRSLDFLNRNHTVIDFTNAVCRIQQRTCFEIGAHLIFGIPGESKEEMITSVTAVCDLGVNALKLHHLQIIRNTPLHSLYLAGNIRLFTQEEYQRFLLQILPIIPTSVTLHRLWATAHPGMLIAPQWNCLASTLSNSLRNKMAERGVWQGQDVGLALGKKRPG